MGLPAAVLKTDLPLPLLARGKVRDVYDTNPVLTGRQGAEAPLLFVASDRISAFDVLMDNVRKTLYLWLRIVLTGSERRAYRLRARFSQAFRRSGLTF